MTNTALDKIDQPSTAIEPATAHERRMTALYRDCKQLAKSELVPKALKNKPENVFALALYGQRYGLEPIHAIQRIFIIEGTFEPKAEVLAGVIIRAGHELRWDEVSADRCTVSIKRAGTDYWQPTTWTIDQARTAGLLDMWVEHRVEDGKWPDGNKKWKVDKAVVGDDTGVFTAEERARRALGPLPEWAQPLVDAGDVKRKDPWFQFRDDMLAAKALRRAGKRVCPDALLGIDDDADPFEPMTPEKVVARRQDDDDLDPFAGHDTDDDPAAAPAPAAPQPVEDDDIADAEIVEDEHPAAAEHTEPEAPPPDDEFLNAADARDKAMKQLMVTCGKAFPETDAAKGTKTERQKLLRRAAQYLVLKEHRSAADLTVDELDQVERWIHRNILSADAVTRVTYEILDGGVVRFTLGEKFIEVSAPEQAAAA